MYAYVDKNKYKSFKSVNSTKWHTLAEAVGTATQREELQKTRRK